MFLNTERERWRYTDINGDIDVNHQYMSTRILLEIQYSYNRFYGDNIIYIMMIINICQPGYSSGYSSVLGFMVI
jgi:hypothetical protein